MEFKSFILSVVETLAWPVIVLVVALVFRSPITGLLNAIRRASANIAGSNVNVEFDRGLAQITEWAAEIPVPSQMGSAGPAGPTGPPGATGPPGPAGATGPTGEPGITQPEPRLGQSAEASLIEMSADIKAAFTPLARIAGLDPVRAIIESWGFVEAEMYFLAQLGGIHAYARSGTLALLLSEKHNFPPELLGSLGGLRDLRNLAVHSAPEITSENAERYVLLAKTTVNDLRFYRR